MTVNDHLFEIFVDQSRLHGDDRALEHIRGLGKYTEAELADLMSEVARRKEAEETGYPPNSVIDGGHKSWYKGVLPTDRFWPGFRGVLEAEGKLALDQIHKEVHQSSGKVLAHTNDPTDKTWSTRGLVVGYVQSGKTTNFTAVVAKAVDNGYNLVIILSGIHNGLRSQTQKRLDKQLFQAEATGEGWIRLTEAKKDFQKRTESLASAIPGPTQRKALAIVAKKNKAPLGKLKDWIKAAQNTSGGLRNVKALVIDDEADQATVDTRVINPLVREILELLPRCTYIGYTATPFANVLIDPAADDPTLGKDLYPKDFIINMPKPDGYFGSEKIFGRAALESEDGPVDGYDMIRQVGNDELDKLGPRKNKDFEPEITASLEEATYWFWLATAARHLRPRAAGDDGHSTMLVHTSTKIQVHREFRDLLDDFGKSVLGQLQRGTGGLRATFERIWNEETARVPAEEFGLTAPRFDDVWNELPAVVEATQVIMDNSKSEFRLDYDKGPLIAIAVGGNTLSRGLTLEGLVVSFFVRAAKAYDTLLQMGRWFGFRVGYEDLPRIWMTDELKFWFRHLATVEQEIRDDIARYAEAVKTPLDFGVRIRTHPELLITSKLGAAKQAKVSYSSVRIHTRYFRRADRPWLETNHYAAVDLVENLVNNGYPEESIGGAHLWRDVSVAQVTRFIGAYRAHDDNPSLDRKMLLRYIDAENKAGSLGTWSVAVMGNDDGSATMVNLGGREVGTIVRSRLDDGDDERADVKTLLSPGHAAIDLPGLSPAQARKRNEKDLIALRNDDPVHSTRGLLLLYPIDPVSAPDPSKPPAKGEAKRVAMDAHVGEDECVVGVALVFPQARSKDAVPNSLVRGVGSASYISVDEALRNLDPAQPIEDVDDELSDDDEDDEPVG